MAKKKKENLINGYLARIKVLGKFYDSAGQTAAEALTNLKPGKGRGMSVLEMRKGDQVRAKVLNPITTMRLFSPSATARSMALKNVISMFSDL